jgi:8-hydroxy-5-deazaflavin:NADPH oxidoreductase
MAYKTFVSLDIAIIGSEKIVSPLALELECAGHNIFTCYEDDLSDLSIIEHAAEAADVIILATDIAHIREIAYWLGDVRKKVIIDATSFLSTPLAENINTLNVIKAITGSTHVAKIYSCADYKHVLDMFIKKTEIDMFMAGDCNKAKEVVKVLAIDMGFRYCHDFGNNSTIPLLEEMVRCWSNFAARQKSTIINITIR